MKSILFLSFCILFHFSHPSEARGLNGDNLLAERFAQKVKIVRSYSYSSDAENAAREGLDDPHLKKYQEVMKAVYLRAPRFLKRSLFDKLETVFIEADENYKFDAWSTVQNRKSFIGFRKSMIDKNIPLSVNFASYDQKSMQGGQKDVINPNLPYIVDSTGSLLDALIGQAGHEFGHILLHHDPLILKKWQKQMGWVTNKKMMDPEMQALKEKICLVSSCDEHSKAPLDVAMKVYEALYRKQWVTWFSLQSSEEDFCEAMSYFTLRFLHPQLVYLLPDGRKLDMMQKLVVNLKNSPFSLRRIFLRRLVKKSEKIMQRPTIENVDIPDYIASLPDDEVVTENAASFEPRSDTETKPESNSDPNAGSSSKSELKQESESRSNAKPWVDQPSSFKKQIRFRDRARRSRR